MKDSTVIMNNNNTKERKPVNVHKFVLWLLIISIIMIFASLLSAYIVRESAGGWRYFPLPQMFNISTVVILISSITFHVSVIQVRKGNIKPAVLWVGASLILGTVFLVTQYLGWQEMKLDFGGPNSNDSSNFLYLLSGLHGVHIISGLIYIFVVMLVLLVGKKPEKHRIRLELCANYWHFLDALWIFLFIFLTLKHLN